MFDFSIFCVIKQKHDFFIFAQKSSFFYFCQNVNFCKVGDIMSLPPKQIGRPRLFANPQDLLDLFRDYLEDAEQSGKMSNIAGFKAFIGISRTVYNSYVDKADFAYAFEIMHNYLEDITINTSNLRVGDTIKKLILQNKFNYSDKIDSNTTNTSISVSKEDTELALSRAVERIKALKPEEKPLLEDVTKM